MAKEQEAVDNLLEALVWMRRKATCHRMWQRTRTRFGRRVRKASWSHASNSPSSSEHTDVQMARPDEEYANPSMILWMPW
jgi:hypothetical protein